MLLGVSLAGRSRVLRGGGAIGRAARTRRLATLMRCEATGLLVASGTTRLLAAAVFVDGRPGSTLGFRFRHARFS